MSNLYFKRISPIKEISICYPLCVWLSEAYYFSEEGNNGHMELGSHALGFLQGILVAAESREVKEQVRKMIDIINSGDKVFIYKL